MKLLVALIALRVLAVAYIECDGSVASKEINGSSEVIRAERSEHNRRHKEMDPGLFLFNVKITWKGTSEGIEYDDKIGKRKDGYIYYKCTGGLIKPTWVVTAASCFQARIYELSKQWDEPWPMTLLPGALVESDQRSSTIKTVHIHDKYMRFQPRGHPDIALVELDSAVDARNHSAGLSQNFYYNEYTSRNVMRNCWVTSFGEDPATAKMPFTMKLSLLEVQAGGPRYCERREGITRRHRMNDYQAKKHDMYDEWFICTTQHEFMGLDPISYANPKDVGCFGEVGSTLTCQHNIQVIVAVQSRGCADSDPYVHFTSVGHWSVYDWIKKIVPDLGRINPLSIGNEIPFNFRDSSMPNDNNTTSTDNKSSTTTMTTCGVLILSLASTITAFIF